MFRWVPLCKVDVRLPFTYKAGPLDENFRASWTPGAIRWRVRLPRCFRRDALKIRPAAADKPECTVTKLGLKDGMTRGVFGDDSSGRSTNAPSRSTPHLHPPGAAQPRAG